MKLVTQTSKLRGDIDRKKLSLVLRIWQKQVQIMIMMIFYYDDDYDDGWNDNCDGDGCKGWPPPRLPLYSQASWFSVVKRGIFLESKKSKKNLCPSAYGQP